jgi:imidazolonepropionase-like amidohydrolase
VAQFVTTRAPVLALENVRVIDGTGAPARQNQTILIIDGRIAAIGRAGRVAIPAGAERHDLTGRTVLPGLVMVHEHMMYFSGQRVWHSQPVSYPRLFLAAGVTTVRTAGGDFPYVDLNLASRIEAGRIAGPRMFVTSPNLNGADDSFIGDNIVRNAEEARREIDYWASRGATSFKLYVSIGPEVAAALIERAHSHRLPVTAHLGRTSCAQAAQLGIDNIEHSFVACLPELGMRIGEDGQLTGAIAPDRARDLIRLLVSRGVVLTSTPISLDPISEEVRSLLHPTALANWETGRGRPPPGLLAAETHVRALERQFLRAGGRLVIGGDAENFGRIAGFANHRALELLAAAGHRPLDILRMATLEGARLLGIDRETGSIAPGKLADLIVVAGDPAVNMSDIRRVEQVFRRGVGYDPVRLRESVRGLVGWH